MLLLNATYTMKPGMRDTFLKEVQAQGILDAVRQEDGCMQYAYYLPAQEDNTLLLVERWRDRAAQQVHLTTPHMTALGKIKADCVVGTQIVSGTAEE